VRANRRAARLATRLAVLALLLVLAAGCGLFRKKPPGERPALRRVSPPVAFEVLRDSPDLPIVDLRSAEEFHGPLGHLMGAINLPLDHWEEDPERHRELLSVLRPRTFLVYCQASCPRETTLHLRELGFDDAMHLWGGIEAWRADGYGTVGAGDPPEHVDEPRGPKTGARDSW